MPQLTSVSLAYPVADATTRAQARSSFEASVGAFSFVTCLRLEILLAGDADGDLGSLPGAITRSGEEAFIHLCRISAGLESPILGEPEVLAQLRSAIATWKAGPTSHPELARVLNAAVGVGRVVRRLMPGPSIGSLAMIAARLASPHDKVAVLGTGLMARSAIEQLAGADVTVIGRRPGEVAGRPIQKWETAVDALRNFPAVISAVPGKSHVWSRPVIAAIAAARIYPLLLIDLGMPPGFELPLEGGVIDYRNVDALAAVAPPTSIPSDVEELLESASRTTWRRLFTPDRAGRVIAEIVARADTVVSEEVSRFAGKLDAADVTILRQLGHKVARRILHKPISFVGDGGDLSQVDLLAEAFGVEDG
jgi:glutamyl-tRNA reductase